MIDEDYPSLTGELLAADAREYKRYSGKDKDAIGGDFVSATAPSDCVSM